MIFFIHYNIIGNDARRARPKTTAAIMAEIIRIDGHGLRPAESHQREGKDPQKIKMLYRVERQAPAELRRRVAAFIGDERVRKFVQRNDDHNREKTCDKR